MVERKLKLLILAFLSFTVIVQAQEQPAFWSEIQDFRKLDSTVRPKTNSILFIGSSSFRMWTDIQNYFPGYPILNRGFGGSTLPDLIHYYKDIILPYKPKQVVIYCGENDLASSDTVTAEVVTKRFEILFYLIRKYCPKVPIVFVSIKPSPSRQHLLPEMLKANMMIRNFLAKRTRTAFVDVYHRMLNADRSPRKELFIEDGLHMNTKGYAIWQKEIAPHLLKK